ncbi:YhgE/Pip domain-containing protein [Microbacterium sp. AK031]|uniref:YhgE/Pip domain-containing protein n=1 Tax=Microbacterium sp. AK031 TaxID=2723076 RepID=UPI002167F687|nr:YhgE/Pip family protein [Microbacterium sp. AK031]MCS3843692.1 putative membrane protein [Microbacterium sp. AK031]
MTLSIERARSRGPITWLTILGILLLPAAVGGILVAALQNPSERLDSMTAAIVNLDEPVTIDDQYTPLGRQLASGLVEGSDDLDSNLTWVISNEDDAAEGLADGSYQAVITIPAEFSSAATSAGQAISEGGGSAEKATIKVTTPDDGLVADDLITGQIASVAASTMGTMLSEATMENVLVGFTTIGDQIGEASSGALELATGARRAADGAAALPDGATKLADGAAQLGTGASELAGGLGTIASGTQDAANGASELGAGLTSGAAALEAPDSDLNKLAGAASAGAGYAKTAADGTTALAGSLGANAQILTALVKECQAPSLDSDFCDRLSATATAIGGNADAAGAAAVSAGAANVYAGNVSNGVSALPSALAGQLRTAGDGALSLADGLYQLASGVGQSATGANSLSTGAVALSDGATALSDGATELATGIDKLAAGTGDLAGGLKTASESLPSFDDQESSSLASVIADPVSSNSSDSSMNTIFGPTAIPLLAAVVLWFGSLASFIVMRAHTARTLTSRRSSAGLALRAFAPAAAIGAGQGILVALIVQFVASYDAAAWWAFAGTAVVAGVAFAAVNQALVALFGGIGRWVSALIGVVAVATGLISTVPAWLASIGEALPTAPAFSGLIAANGSALASLVVWGVLSLIATTLIVAVRRTTSAKAVLAAG